MLRWVIALVFLLAPSIAFAATTDTTLSNGLRVVIDENHDVPLVAVAIRYGVGTSMDPEGRAGLNELTMWLMGHKSVHVPENGFETNLDRVGAWWRYWSNLDNTEFYASLPSNELELALWLFSDQMGFFTPAIDAASIANRLGMMNAQRAQVMTDGWSGLVSELASAEMYPTGHPYRKPPLAYDRLTNVTPDEVRKHHEKWYIPRNAVLVIAGDAKTTPTMNLVAKYFGAIPQGNQPPLQGAIAPILTNEVRLDVAARVERAAARIDWATPALFDAGDAELDVVAGILNGARITKLRWELLSKRKIATDFYVRQESHKLGSRFVIRVTGVSGKKPQELVDGIDDVLKAFDTTPITEDDRLGSLGFVVIPKIVNMESSLFRAREITQCVMAAGEVDFTTRNYGRYGGVDIAALQTAIKTWLPLQRRVVTTVTPDATAPIQGVLRSRTVKP